MEETVVEVKKPNKPRRHVLPKSDWNRLPKSMRQNVRQGTPKGEHSLRAHPSREWWMAAKKILGDHIRIPHDSVRGDGIYKVKVDSDGVVVDFSEKAKKEKKSKRKRAKKEEEPKRGRLVKDKDLPEI